MLIVASFSVNYKGLSIKMELGAGVWTNQGIIKCAEFYECETWYSRSLLQFIWTS